MGGLKAFVAMIVIIPGLIGLCSAQIRIKGTITDQEGNALPSASVFVYSQQILLHATLSGSTGHYEASFPREKVSGETVRIVFRSMGYTTDTLSLTLSDQNEYTLPVVLASTDFKISEVIIQASPMVMKGDTIIYDVKSFLTGNEAVVEDLLKNLPGLEVDREGTVTFQNKEVEKIMVDGDDFFRRGYRLLSQNMPPHPLETVELLQNYSENKLLKGIEESDRVALNLTLRDDAMGLWFGNTALGLDPVSLDFYRANVNLMNFKRLAKYYFLVNANNIGNSVDSRALTSLGTDEIGNQVDARTLIHPTSVYLNMDAGRYQQSHPKTASANSIYTLKDSAKLKIGLLVNQMNQSKYQQYVLSYLLPDGTSFSNTEFEDFQHEKWAFWNKIEVENDISKNTMLLSRTTTDFTFNSYDKRFYFQNNQILDQINSRKWHFSQDLNITRKISDNSVLIYKGRYLNQQVPQEYGSPAFFFQSLFPEISENVSIQASNQSIAHRLNYLGNEFHYFYRDKHLFEFILGNETRQDDILTELTLFDDARNRYLPESAQNELRYRLSDTYMKGKVHLLFSRFEVSGTMAIHHLLTDKSFLVTVPRIYAKWDINLKNSISFQAYRNFIRADGAYQTRSYVHTSFRILTRNDADWDHLDRTNYSLGYQFGDAFDDFRFRTSIRHTHDHDYLANHSIVSPEFIESRTFINKNRKNWAATLRTDYFIASLAHNIALDGRFQHAEYQHLVNNSIFQPVRTKSFDAGILLKSGFISPLNYSVEFKNSVSVFASTTSRTLQSQHALLGLTYNKGPFWLTPNAQMFRFKSLSGQADSFTFIDLKASWNNPAKKWKLDLAAMNLANIRTYKQTLIHDLGYWETQTRLQPRQLVMSLEYRF